MRATITIDTTASPAAVANERRRVFTQPLALYVALAAICALGAAIRFYLIDLHSLWYDEVASIEVAQRGLSAIFTDRFGWMRVQTPLHYVLVWLTIQPVDPTQTAFLVRLPSALAGSLTPLVVYSLGKEMFGRWQGLLAALLMAVSTIHINYSNDARPYALFILLTLLSSYSLLVAQRTGDAKWWIAFGASTVANVLGSYYSLTMVLTALAPYLLWSLWRLWSNRRQGMKSLIYALASMAVLAGASIFMWVDMMQVPRTSPNLGRFPFSSLATLLPEFALWFTPLGLGGQLERLLQLGLFLLAIVGFYAAIKAGGVARRGAILCGLFMVIPPVVLAALATSNTVFQKYALPSMPLYFLLIINGAVSLAMAAKSRRLPTLAGRALAGVGISLAAGAALLFALSAAGNFSAYPQNPVIIRPDYQGVAHYLAESAKPQDAVVFVVWGDVVANFYWNDKPPANVYNALDPRFFEQPARGSVYWVVGYMRSVPTQVMGNPRWAETRHFERVVVLREDNPSTRFDLALERLIAELDSAEPRDEYIDRAISTARGGIYQARGEVAAAAAAYRQARSYFLIGDEYLNTSRGFAERGDYARAWRDALIGKSMQTDDPKMHSWLAELLALSGSDKLTSIQAKVAAALR